MGDISLSDKKGWLVSPTKDVEQKWIEIQIQEKISRINRHRQDIDDLKKGKIVDLEAKIKMLELEKTKLEGDLLKARSIEAKQ